MPVGSYTLSSIPPTRVTSTVSTINANAVASTLRAVIGLELPLLANQGYYLEAIIPYTAAAVTTGSRWALDGPAFSQLNFRSRYTLNATTNTFNYPGAYLLPVTPNVSSLLNGNLCTFEGIIVTTAAGLLRVLFASEIAGSAITALPFGTLSVTPIP